jgi:FkbM family methyltransferase
MEVLENAQTLSSEYMFTANKKLIQMNNQPIQNVLRFLKHRSYLVYPIGRFVRKRIIRRQTFDILKNQYLELIEISRKSTESKSEYFQDLWVIAATNVKRNGYFVEFGASNGIDASNTWLLEKKFGWKGVLAEPSKSNFELLSRNRNCGLDSRAIWDQSHEQLLFCERDENYLSSVKSEGNKGSVREEYFVTSVSLNDLLDDYKAPNIIDYVSIDVEGSELRILESFFKDKKYEVKLFTVEHNWRKDKKSIIELMQNNNYENVFTNLSHRDLFFVKRDN